MMFFRRRSQCRNPSFCACARAVSTCGSADRSSSLSAGRGCGAQAVLDRSCTACSASRHSGRPCLGQHVADVVHVLHAAAPAAQRGGHRAPAQLLQHHAPGFACPVRAAAFTALGGWRRHPRRPDMHEARIEACTIQRVRTCPGTPLLTCMRLLVSILAWGTD